MPADGAACPCTPWFEHAQYETDCFVENGLGRCTAARTCGEPCPALAPAAETCDGRDEDCDGDTDEGVDDRPCELENEHGTCTGTGTCVAGKLLCQGEYPSPESCDGKDDDCDGDTDEGFPDTNGDGVADCVDEDLDGDGVKNLDDNCLEVPNPDQSDTDQDGDGDLCDSDDDNDGIPDLADNCRHVPNPFQQDCDKDGAGDACEDDADADGVADAADNCPDCKWNPGQEDADADGAGDACDPDDDGDFVPDAADNCPLLANGDQADTDKDGAGDACDPDDDGDGVADGDDNCPLHANADQSDLDQDGPGDACDEDKDGDTIPNGADNCPGTPNPDQIDENENQVGDACEDDWDGDGVANGEDNCAWVANAGQGDMDLDGAGDACDCDADGDGLGNDNPKCAPPVPADNCAWIANPGQEDADADGIGDACDPDRDGDGDPNGADCAPDDPTVGHGAAEVCDGTDDDCDGATDEQGAAGCATFFLDADQDGWGTDDGRCLCAADGLHTATRKGDCRDQDAAVSPGVEEACNSIDDDCDKVVDEEDAVGCTTFYRDLDQDKYGPTSDARCLCAALKPYTAELPGDCNDLDDSVKPGGTEKCNKKDDDCSGAADEPGAIGCSLYFADADGDGFGVAGSTICVCVPAVPFTATKAGDCNDGDATSYPGSAERCNGLDDDCDGAVDEDGASGCSPYFLDADRDGFGGASASVCKCQPAAPYDATKTGDCNDNDPSISPGAGERCNARDDNCDGAIDEEGATGCTAWWLDADQDGAGAGGQSKCLCAPAGKYTAAAGSDCNDADKAVYPGAAEACNAKDDDCDGVVDEAGATGCQSYWRDGDLDGWGVSGDMRCGCGPDPQYSATKTGDCNDADAGVNPGVAERCGNAVDEDCDGQTSEPGCVGCTTYWQDADHDDWGTGAGSCLEAPSGNMTALKAGDCNDADPLVNPAAPEKCNLKDDDCNGATDGEGAQGCSTYHLDQDQDLYGTDASSKCLCAALGQYTALSGGDCNDADKAVHPGVVESCNQKDDDCDGTADEDGAAGCVQRFPDADHDTWGVSGGSRCTCAPAGDLTATRGGDCDDGDAAVMPGAAEACNGRDDDCDGQTDEEGTAGCTLFYADADADGYGAAAQSKCLCAASGVFKVTQPGDCNDADYNVNPGRPEVCNGRDDDCDGQQDAEGAIGCTAYFTDADDDRFGTGSQTRCLCAASGTWRATVAGDCDDALATVNPAATESCNGRDDDCNGVKDEAGATGCVTYFLDADGDAWGVTGG
ncbi:MAG: thrombospondin type 3 repeat-containing protein, partial [Deltaproteobacteria bacterium]|nr:thrombospondin type 3 repeat-containing protein [Deltaproteobacteria bacterium]